MNFKWLSFKILAHFWAFFIFLFFFCNSISPLGKDLSFPLCLLKVYFVFSSKRHILFWICFSFNFSTFVNCSIYFSQPQLTKKHSNMGEIKQIWVGFSETNSFSLCAFLCCGIDFMLIHTEGVQKCFQKMQMCKAFLIRMGKEFALPF